MCPLSSVCNNLHLLRFCQSGLWSPGHRQVRVETRSIAHPSLWSSALSLSVCANPTHVSHHLTHTHRRTRTHTQYHTQLCNKCTCALRRRAHNGEMMAGKDDGDVGNDFTRWVVLRQLCSHRGSLPAEHVSRSTDRMKEGKRRGNNGPACDVGYTFVTHRQQATWL